MYGNPAGSTKAHSPVEGGGNGVSHHAVRTTAVVRHAVHGAILKSSAVNGAAAMLDA